MRHANESLYAPLRSSQHIPHTRSRRLNVPDSSYDIEGNGDSSAKPGHCRGAGTLFVQTSGARINVSCGDAERAKIRAPIHRKFLLVARLYWSILGQALYNLHSSVKLRIYQLSRVHLVPAQLRVRSWDTSRARYGIGLGVL